MNNRNLLIVLITGIACLLTANFLNGKRFSSFDSQISSIDTIQVDKNPVRDKSLVKVSVEDLTAVEWKGASTLKQKIQKEDGIWYYAGMEAVDSTLFQTYLTSLVNAQGTEFSELTSTDGLTLAEQLTLYSNNMEAPTRITAFNQRDSLSPFLIHSSANPESIFKSDSSGLYKKIFTDLRQFWPYGQ